MISVSFDSLEEQLCTVPHLNAQFGEKPLKGKRHGSAFTYLHTPLEGTHFTSYRGKRPIFMWHRHLDELRDIGSYLKMAVQHKNYKTSLEQRLKITKTLLQGEGKDF